MKAKKSQFLRVAIYIRVSSDEQAEKGDSIRDQQERCTDYINRNPDMILQGVYIDDGISGQKLDRDDLQALLQAVEAGKIDRIIFTKLDRWFRSLRHYLNTQEFLNQYGVEWTAIDQPYFDTSTPYGQAFVSQSMTWAELEAKNGGIRVKDVFKTKVQHGEVITGKVLICHKIVDKHIELSEYAPAIYDCVQYFLKTQSIADTTRYLASAYGIHMTKTNFKAAYLRNEKLTGRYRGNENYCPRIITDEMYNEVQRILDANMNVKCAQKYDYIFSGLIVCDECGRKMAAGHISVKTIKKSGAVYRYRYPAYHCKYYSYYKTCTNVGDIRETAIEAYLLEHIEEELSQYVAEYDVSNKAIQDNRLQKSRIRKKLDKLKELYLNDLISLDEYKIDRINLEEQLSSLPDTAACTKDLSAIKILLNSDFKNLYQTFLNTEKRLFWRSILKEIRISEKDHGQRKYTIVPL